MAAEHDVPEVPLTAETGAPYNELSIAVLPFWLVDFADDEYLADGLTEDIISALARFPDLTVLAPKLSRSTKARRPPGRRKSPRISRSAISRRAPSAAAPGACASRCVSPMRRTGR